VQTDDNLQDHTVDAPPPEERAVQMESLDLLHEELEQLTEGDREIVELRHLQDRSFEQIARQKNLPPSTIKDRCYRAVDKIRMRMKRRYGRA
jgi:RNA polymerase sigma factor (sigma-70 family)